VARLRRHIGWARAGVAEVAGESRHMPWRDLVNVTPQVFSRSVNPNEQVNKVDFGQMTVNLGHHLENITNDPFWSTLVKVWSNPTHNPLNTL
jgi:hypothetical protein